MLSPDIESYVRDALARSTTELSPYASEGEIQDYLSQFDSSQAEGIANNVKGITHEMLYVDAENSDGDFISAQLQDAVNNPGSDVILTNDLTGMQTELQLKATDSPGYIQNALDRYPDVDVMATSEVANQMGVPSTGINNQDLTDTVQKYLGEMGLESFDPNISDYVNKSTADAYMESHSVVDNGELNTILSDTFGSDLEMFLDAGLAGGYIGYLELLQDNPKLQRKVMKAGLALGILDGYIDIDGINDEFEFGPLLAASAATWISKLSENSEEKWVKAFGNQFNVAANAALKITTFGGYSAAALTTLDILTPGVDIIDSFCDFLGFADDAWDAVANPFMAFSAGRLVSSAIGKLIGNDTSKSKVDSLNAQIASKRMMQKLLVSEIPAPLLIGPASILR